MIIVRKGMLELNVTEQRGSASIVENRDILLSIVLSRIRDYQETSRDASQMKKAYFRHQTRSQTMIGGKVPREEFMS